MWIKDRNKYNNISNLVKLVKNVILLLILHKLMSHPRGAEPFYNLYLQQCYITYYNLYLINWLTFCSKHSIVIWWK